MKFFIAILALVVLAVSGCAPSPEAGRSKIEGLAKTVSAGMSETEVRKLFGEPDEIVKAEAGKITKLTKQDPKKIILWRFKKLDQYWELWVRFYDGKATWAMAYDKSSTLSTG